MNLHQSSHRETHRLTPLPGFHPRGLNPRRLGVFALFLARSLPTSLCLLVVGAFPYLCCTQWLSSPIETRWAYRLHGWRAIGVVAGVLLFVSITSHSDPAMAQLFNTAEQQANTIFGQYLQQGIITFLFGMLRLVIWVSAVGFIFFAIYQAQRGEQWQPLIQNAFIIVAAVVVVEGLSRLFFGKT